MEEPSGSADGERRLIKEFGVLVISVQKVTLSKSLIRPGILVASGYKSLISPTTAFLPGADRCDRLSVGVAMARWDYCYLGFERFPDALSALEIEQFFTLEAAELAEVRRRRGSMNRLAVALHIGFLKMTGTPLNRCNSSRVRCWIISVSNSRVMRAPCIAGGEHCSTISRLP